MDIATSKSRMWQLALVGVATAFAWIVLSLLLGLGSGQARADDATDGKGLLGAVTSLVDETASTLTSTVTTVTGEVTGVVNAVVEVAPAPVQQPVSEVVQSVGTVVTTVTEPVTEVVSGGVVGTVTAPIVAVVEEVPVVGGIVSEVGLGDAIEDVAGTVDETVGGVVDAVGDTGSSIGQPPAGENPVVPPVLPELPGLPGTATPDSAASAGTDARAAADRAPAMAPNPAFSLGAASALLLVSGAYEPVGSASSAAVMSSSGASSDARGPLSPAGDLCPPVASSSGPGGAGLGAWALVALGPLAAHRAWVRRAGPEDEHAPPAPAGSTDVSPD